MICVVNTPKKTKQTTHLHSNCNITDAERETIFIWSKWITKYKVQKINYTVIYIYIYKCVCVLSKINLSLKHWVLMHHNILKIQLRTMAAFEHIYQSQKMAIT